MSLPCHSLCKVIGVLDNGATGLSAEALTHIQNADVIIGGRRTLNLFSEEFKVDANQHDLTGALTTVPEWIQQAQNAHQKCVVLATGDPLCHGIGKYLLGKLGPEHCEIIPNVSSLQLACAKLGIAWQEAKICSVHSKDAGDWHADAGPEHGLYPLLQACGEHDLLIAFTSPENDPSRIARMLSTAGLSEDFSLSVAEALLTPEENIRSNMSIAEATETRFIDPNMVVLQRKTPRSTKVLMGLTDDSFVQRKPDKGLITKREVRALSLARMQLRTDSVVWDIGAGSGSVGLEAARLCTRGFVYAMEKNAEDAAIARQNQQILGVINYRLTEGKAPHGLDLWPDPDAVFIGGSGGELAELIELCLSRLKTDGWLVMNFVTLENLASATDCLKQLDAVWDVTQLQASRSQPILHMNRLQAENPVWVVSAQKESQAGDGHE